MRYDIRQIGQEDFPVNLREIYHPPEHLWLRGKLPETGTKTLAIVGSRAASQYGKESTAMLVGGLAGYPISIVSGLALGIDAEAHKAALSAGLHTIAIPGSGLDDSIIYPRTNRMLANEILTSGGALLSEHQPKHVARAYDFPSRNRIMVGIADAVLIIESAKRSGTLITARLAGEYNRDLLCVPHRIGDPHGFGAHLFIRLGAGLVTEPFHILEALHIAPRESSVTKKIPSDLSKSERIIYDTLSEPHARDDLIRITKLQTSDVLTALVSLELRGLTKEEFGAWIRT